MTGSILVMFAGLAIILLSPFAAPWGWDARAGLMATGAIMAFFGGVAALVDR